MPVRMRDLAQPQQAREPVRRSPVWLLPPLIDIMKFYDAGQMSEHWALSNALGAQQLGAIPAARPA
jgi:hypothetical protein